MKYIAPFLLGAGVLGVCIIGCGDFLPLDEDPPTSVWISRFEPMPVQPIYDPQRGVLLPPSIMYVANASQVPVTFSQYKIQYYEAVSVGGQFPVLGDLNSEGLLTVFVPGVPTPDPYVPDSTATRQTVEVAVGGLQVLSAKAYDRASNGTVLDYSDDMDMFAVVTLTGETESGITAEISGAVPISTLLGKE